VGVPDFPFVALPPVPFDPAASGLSRELVDRVLAWTGELP
jgi:hypothetical protein